MRVRSTVHRVISEIESYLSSPVMREADGYWQQEERRSLCELLELLKSQKG